MKRAVRTILRLVAAGLVVFGGLEFGLELMRHRLEQAEVSLWHCLIGVVLTILGVGLFAASARLAKRWTADFED
jgi:hypothetical protein